MIIFSPLSDSIFYIIPNSLHGLRLSIIIVWFLFLSLIAHLPNNKQVVVKKKWNIKSRHASQTHKVNHSHSLELLQQNIGVLLSNAIWLFIKLFLEIIFNSITVHHSLSGYHALFIILFSNSFSQALQSIPCKFKLKITQLSYYLPSENQILSRFCSQHVNGTELAMVESLEQL